MIEELNVEEERKLSTAVDIEALREQDTNVGQPVIESFEFSPIPMPLLPSYQVGDSEYILLIDTVDAQ